MGIIFGRTGTQEPKYVVIRTFTAPIPFEVRKNPSYFIAEVPMETAGSEGNHAFSVLAKYIGVFGTPENEGSTSLAMTAPVIIDPTHPGGGGGSPVPLAMTAPVIVESQKMSFVLPFHLKDISEVPVPKDKRVTIRAIPSTTVAVTKFSGWYTDGEGRRHLQRLIGALKEHRILPP